MLLSMTGFSSELVSIDIPTVGHVSLAIEMKAINSRFFEASCKLPSVFSSLEVKIINLLQKKLVRGRVYCSVRFAEDNEAFETVEPSLKNVQGYLAAANKISQVYGVDNNLTVRDLFMLPNIFVSTQGNLEEHHEEVLLSLVGRIADRLTQTRAEEGKALLADFKTRFGLCRANIEKIDELFERLMLKIKGDVDAKLAEYQATPTDQLKVQLDDLYSTLNKSDIHEEITRFKSHLAATEALLVNASVEKGKRLDFILQELLRETNTIMAKCSTFEISSVGVDIKVELEKVREQVQNVM